MTDKKYELTDEKLGVLRRIRALRDIPHHGVKAGDIGGWVESEGNLSQEAEAWIADAAKVRDFAVVSGAVLIKDRAMVCENAVVNGNAVVGDRACIQGHAFVAGSARIKGDARIKDHATVNNHSLVTGSATVMDYAEVGGNARVDGNAVLRHHAYVTGRAHVHGGVDIHGYTLLRGDADVRKAFPQATRSDGYIFSLVPTKDGPKMVMAGCRAFTMREYRDHAEVYDNFHKTEETLAILDFLEAADAVEPWDE